MSYTITLGQLPAGVLFKAANFIREKYNLGDLERIHGLFDREFNIKLVLPEFNRILDYELVFRSEAEYLVFLMRWS